MENQSINKTPIYSYEEAFNKSLSYFNGDELASKVFVDKYALRNNSDEILEDDPEKMHRRIAKELARIELKKFKKPLSEDIIFSYLDKFKKIIFQGGIMFGCGNLYQYITLSNCYVLESPTDSYSGICKTDEQLVQISKRRGGCGIDISHIRPINSVVKNSSRTSTGIVPFMRRFSNSIREVGQGGRRGALMMTISVHHPEVLNFISIKKDKNEITGANISIKLTNEFLNAVSENKEYEQRWPVDSKTPSISKKVNAKDIWNTIIECAHEMAEPGLLFWDNILHESPADSYSVSGYNTTSCNPCCFAQDSIVKVVTSNGIKEIKDITEQDLIWIDYKQQWKKNSGYFNAGISDVYKVTFSNNEDLFITDCHKLAKAKFKRVGTKLCYNGFDLVELKNLLVGDRISIHTNKVNDYKLGHKGTYNEGLIMGWMTGDGCLSYHDDKSTYPDCILDFWSGEYDVADKIYQIFCDLGYELKLGDNGTNNVKRIKTHVFTRYFTNKYGTNIWKFKSHDLELPFLNECSLEFLQGFISSYFSADGTVYINYDSKDYNISLTSINKARLLQIKNLLLYFGIRSMVYLVRKSGETEFKNGGKYQTKDCWKLVISGEKYIERFYNNFGFLSERKNKQLKEIISIKRNKETKYQDYITIKSIELIGKKPVGCIEVEDEHSLTVNGIISGQSELPLSILDSCRLGLINLFSYVQNPFTNKAKFNYGEFFEDCKILQRMMDNIVDLELECIDRIIDKIKSDPESKDIKSRELELWIKIKKTCLDGRRTGTGITALGDTLAGLNMSYCSKESISEVDKIYKTLKLACYWSSVEMSKELGPFNVWNHELEKDNPFLLRIKDDDDELWKAMKKYGRRNIAILTTAPTGSVSILTQTTSGIEPLFQMSYIRRKKITHEDKNSRVDFVDNVGDKWQEFTIHHNKLKEWMDITKETDIKKSPWHNCCAEDLDWKNRVKLQSIAQRHIDHAISSTLNLPEDISVEKVSEIYETAWKSGCKGVTIYRKNCRTGVLIDKKEQSKIIQTNAPKRPKVLKGEMHHFTLNKHRYYVAVGFLGAEIYEVFTSNNHDDDGNIIIPKNIQEGSIRKDSRSKYTFVINDKTEFKLTNGHTDDNVDALTRILSLSLRHGAGLEFVVHQLEKTKGPLVSFSKVLARTLKKYIKDGTKIYGENCTSCGGANLQRDSGCTVCRDCGASHCS